MRGGIVKLFFGTALTPIMFLKIIYNFLLTTAVPF
jgi:hypothetical protein